MIEGENIINLYYTFLSGEYIPENPDFPPGEGEEIESPYIEEFWDGELDHLRMKKMFQELIHLVW